MDTGDVLQLVPDLEVASAIAILNVLVIPQADPQLVGHLLLRPARLPAGFFQVFPHAVPGLHLHHDRHALAPFPPAYVPTAWPLVRPSIDGVVVVYCWRYCHQSTESGVAYVTRC